MTYKLFCMASLLALPLAAQTPDSEPADLSSYQGPGIASPGVGNIGTASGQPTDLRFYAGVSGIYDTNIQPFVTDAKGNLVRAPNLWGISFGGGAYGSHAWHRSQLSLSYAGNYVYYPDSQNYNGTNQSLTLGYTDQLSSRWVFDARVSGNTLNQTTGAVANAATSGGATSTTAPFDTRSSGVLGSSSITFLQTTRTSYTFGGAVSTYIYDSAYLTDYQSASANAGFTHRLSQSNSFGARYMFSYQTGSGGAFTMKTHTMGGQFSSAFARGWTLSLDLGATISQLNESIGLDLPVLFNNGTYGLAPFLVPVQLNGVYPSGSIDLRRQFRRALLFGNAAESVGGGNGLLTGTRNLMARGGISYTGFRKWNFGLDGSYQKYSSLGGGISRVISYGGGAGFTYELVRYTHLTGRFDLTNYDYSTTLGQRTAKRVTIGISFTPKDIPLSLW